MPELEPWSLGAGLEGKGAVVTGAAGGIGHATAELLAASGARVFATDVVDDRLREVVDSLGGAGPHVAHPFDLRDTAGLSGLIEEARTSLGRLDVLAHVGATLRRLPLDRVTEADWDLQQDVNLKSTFFLNRAAGELMKARGEGGRIINFASTSWQTGPAWGSHVYVASKGGVITLTRAMARAYGPHGITVNVVSPGQIDTPMQHDDNSPEVLEEATARCPLGRMGDPHEVAAVVVFLASQHASFVSGATVTVSGGAVMW